MIVMLKKSDLFDQVLPQIFRVEHDIGFHTEVFITELKIIKHLEIYCFF